MKDISTQITANTYQKHVESITRGYIEEQEILSIKKALNNNRYNLEQATTITKLIGDCTPHIGPEQAEKGLRWLMNKWQTPKGKERKNNPFGFREQVVLGDFHHFTLEGFHDFGTGGWPNYQPAYAVHSNTGLFFVYRFSGGNFVSSYYGDYVEIVG